MSNKINIILVFNKEEVDTALKNKLIQDRNFKIVPWSLQALDYIISKSIDYYDISDEFSNENYLKSNEWNKLILKYKNWCSRIDDIILNEIDEIKKIELKIFESLFIEVRGLFFTAYEETKKINYMRENTNISKIFFFDHEKISNLTNSLLLHYSNIDPFKFNKIKITSIPISIKNNGYLNDSWKSIDVLKHYDIKKNSIIKILLSFFKINIKYIMGLEYYYKSLNDLYAATFPKKIKKDTILIYDAIGSDFSPIINNLRKIKDFKIIFREDFLYNKNNSLNLNLKKIKQKLLSDTILEDLATFNKINLSKIFNDKIIAIIKDNAQILYDNAIFFIELNKTIKNRLILTSHQNAFSEFCFLHADKFNIPNIVFQHGFTSGFSHLGPHSPEYMRIGSKNYNYFFYTKAIVDFQKEKKKIFQSNLNFYSLGSIGSFIHLNKAKKIKKILSDTINVCYVFGSTNTDKKFHRGRWNDLIQYNLVLNLINKFANQNNIKFYIKLGYNIEFQLPYLLKKIKNIPNISIISSKKSLNNIIHNMDLFILNDFSTPLKEILATNQSILILENKSTSDETEIFRDNLSRRATITSNTKNFDYYLDDLLAMRRKSEILSESKFKDKTFFNTYCIEKNSNPIVNIDKQIHALLKKTEGI